MQPKFIMMVGAQCAGKSNWARKQEKEEFIVVSNDEFLYEGDKYVWCEKRAQTAIKKAEQKIHFLIDTGANVIYDATWTRPHRRKEFMDIFFRRPYSIGFHYYRIAVVIDTPVDLCLERNSRRSKDRRIPENTITSAVRWVENNPPKYSEGFDEIRFVAGFNVRTHKF